jgi:hypothetical protein
MENMQIAIQEAYPSYVTNVHCMTDTGEVLFFSYC